MSTKKIEAQVNSFGVNFTVKGRYLTVINGITNININNPELDNFFIDSITIKFEDENLFWLLKEAVIKDIKEELKRNFKDNGK